MCAVHGNLYSRSYRYRPNEDFVGGSSFRSLIGTLFAAFFRQQYIRMAKVSLDSRLERETRYGYTPELRDRDRDQDAMERVLLRRLYVVMP